MISIKRNSCFSYEESYTVFVFSTMLVISILVAYPQHAIGRKRGHYKNSEAHHAPMGIGSNSGRAGELFKGDLFSSLLLLLLSINTS